MSGLSSVTPIVLAGGRGTRLQSVVSDRPKVLAPVAGRPFLAWLLDRLAAAGARECTVSTGHMADMVERELGAQHGPMALAYSREDEPLGTGGGLALAVSRCEGDTFLVLNGDTYADVDLAGFARWFAGSGAEAALLLVRVDDTSRYGSVQLGPDGTVAAFREKDASAGSGLINAGVYLLKRSVAEAIPPGSPCSLEHDVFPPLAARDALVGWPVEAAFLDIGTPASYARAEAFLQGLTQNKS